MTSRLPFTTKSVLRQRSRQLTLAAQPASTAVRAFDALPKERLPLPPASTSQTVLDRNAYYGGLLLRAVLASNGSSSAVLSSSGSSTTNPLPGPGHSSPPPEKVSDHEWEIRTGRATYILQQTLPQFFELGLVSSVDQTTGEPSTSTTMPWSLASPTGTWHTLKDKLTSAAKSKEENDETPSIYSPRVRLTYTPPTPLPAPFPKTLHAEGLHLYIASSIFVRHTLNALYTNLMVDVTRARVSTGGVSQGGGSTSSLPLGSDRGPAPKISREKSIAFGLSVSGVGRVSGARAEWEVNCTYTFSPLTGLIIHHAVDSIEPAPHHALFEALGKFGLLEGGIGPKPGGVGS